MKVGANNFMLKKMIMSYILISGIGKTSHIFLMSKVENIGFLVFFMPITHLQRK